MNESDLMQKIQKLQTDQALTADEVTQIKGALEAKKKLPWLLVTAVLLSVILSISSYQRMKAGREDQLPVGFTRSSSSDGITLDYRWVSGTPSKPIRFFTTDGQWEFRPHGSTGAKPGLIFEVPKGVSREGTMVPERKP